MIPNSEKKPYGFFFRDYNDMNKKYFVQQHDECDCGATCLSMIFRYNNIWLPFNDIRSEVFTGPNGTNIENIVNASNNRGIEATPLVGSISELKQAINSKEVCFPFIAHIKSEEYLHFVVVDGLNQLNQFIILDPAKGKCKVKIDEFSEIWTEKIISFKARVNIKPIEKNIKNNNEYFEIFKTHFLIIGLILLLSFLGIFINLFSSILVQKIIDGLSRNGTYIIQWLEILFLLLLLRFISNLINGILFSKIEIDFEQKIKKSFFDKYIKWKKSYFQSRKTGAIVSRFYNIEDVRNTIYEASVAIVVNSVMLIIYAIFISYYSFKVAFIILMSLLFYSIICFFLANPLRIINMKIKGDAEDVISFLKECSEGYDFIKTHNIKDKIISMMNDRIKTYSDSLYKGSIFYNKVISVKNYLSDLYNFCILGLCVFLIYKGFLSVGEVVSLYLIFSYMLDAANRVIDIIPQTKTVGVAIDRIDDVLNGLTEDDTNKIDYSAGDIEFKNVDFSYDGGYQVFNNLNLKFLQGESVAIIGNNGSGKSTLAKILLNIYDLDRGIITVNGRDITQIKKEELKKNILYIPTSPFIFSGTIIDNLLFEKKQNVSEEEIIEVCKKVGLHDYIDSLPEKYNSYMIENGSSFSSGQKQRFELARLLLNKPAVIIFDEITSNMDNDGITLFKEIVSEIKKDSIIIIITHNIEMANMCDNIYLINKKNMTCINGEKDERYFNNHRC